MIDLFVQLDELDESTLKKFVSMIRHRLETAEEGAVEVIDIDDNTVDLVDVNDDETDGTTTEEEADDANDNQVETAASPLRQRGRKPAPASISLEKKCFYQHSKFQNRGIRSDLAEKKARQRAVNNIVRDKKPKWEQ